MSDIDESMDRYRNRRGIPPKEIKTGESKKKADQHINIAALLKKHSDN